MSGTKFITIEGSLDVIGIYNFNRSTKNPENPIYKNHKEAKKDLNGIDYTSSRCLRHEMFKDIQPIQPTDAEFADSFIDFVASEAGLLRGFVAMDVGFKRASPIHFADAYTQSIDGKSKIFYDQGSSSKPKESDKKNKKGEDIADNSMFSQDNSGPRKQTLKAAINIKELQFIHLDKKDDNFRVVSLDGEDLLILKLNQFFEINGVKESVEVKEYDDISAVLKTKRRGILLSQNQIKLLIKKVVFRIANINGAKAGARITTDKKSLDIVFSDGIEGSVAANFSDFSSKLEKSLIHNFFESNQ
ncbi:MAG: hypothetical protein WA160_02270 [Pseudobdellovibrio sp.]